MADEKNQNDQVQDLLARLRSQMNQLDEMFGLADEPQASHEKETPAVSEELPQSECAVPDDEELTAEGAEEKPIKETESDALDAVSPEASEESASDDSPSVASDEPMQLDLFADIDALLGETACENVSEKLLENEHESASQPQETASDADDDTPVFSKSADTVHIRKESIVAQELVSDAAKPEDAVVVTEGEHAPEALREQAQTHASFFVPNTQPAEDEVKPTSLSPFSPDRRFDPSKYDAMLAAYEKRKAESFTDEASSKEEACAPAPTPQAPILMPTATPIVEKPSASENEEKPEENAVFAEEAVEEIPEELVEELDDESVEEPLEVIEDALSDASAEESTQNSAEIPVEEPAENSFEEPAEAAPLQETPSEEEPVKEEPDEQTPVAPPTSSRVVLAQADLSDTDRDLRSRVSSGRVHLAPTAYRAKDERAQGKNRPSFNDDDEEDFMNGLPRGIRESLVGSPLGRPNRAQTPKKDEQSAAKTQRKRKSYRFPEETAGVRDEDAASDYVRHDLRETLRQTRARLIVLAVLAFVLLLLENISLVEGFVPQGFVDVKTAGIIDALLLVGAAIAAWPRLSVGAKGLFHGRILPESILLLEVLAALAYAVVFGALGTPTMYLSFVPALGLAILYCFRVLHGETSLRVLEKKLSAGEKLLLSPTAKKDMAQEIHALGKSLDGETPLVYRVRKTATVKGFSERCGRVCEDEKLNLSILLSSIGVGLVCFFLAFFTGDRILVTAFRAALFGCFLSSPLMMLGVHVYCMHRTDRVAGEDSAIAGEATVEEATGVDAVCFEDIEAAPSSGVTLSGIRVHCDDPTVVFKYLTALYGHIGGPLCGRFSGMYYDKNATNTTLVSLVDATQDGVSAAIDGAELVVGNGRYMVASGIAPTYDAEDEKVLSNGRSGVLYVAVNGMVCLKFFMEHRISAAFEKNALRLHRLGIATILRTYDPNFNDKTLVRSTALGDARVHVVSKTKEQCNDFYAERAAGGIITSNSSAKLLRLLLLCFRTRRMLRFGKGYKLVGAVLGGALSVALCVLGIFAFVPSVYLALYHLVLLVIYMAVAALGVKLPEISEGK